MATAVAAPATPPATADGDLGTVARLGAQKSKFKAAAKRLTEERDAEKTKVAELEKKIAELEKSGGAQRITELETKLREVGHRSKFNEAAKAAGVHEKAVDDLWEKSGYKAEGETPDEAKIKAAIDAQKEQRPFLFGDAANNSQQPDQPLELAPGPGRGQGGNAANDRGPLGLTQAQLRNPQFMMQNQAAILKASKEAMNLPISQVPTKLAIM